MITQKEAKGKLPLEKGGRHGYVQNAGARFYSLPLDAITAV